MSKPDIRTVIGRAKLAPRREPYWQTIGKGRYLGFRVLDGGKLGTWIARYSDTITGKKPTLALGDFAELTGAERFNAAKKKADEWFDHLRRGGSTEARTFGEAIAPFIEHCQKIGLGSASSYESTLKRFVPPDSVLYRASLMDLSGKVIQAWRQSMPRDVARSTYNNRLNAVRGVLGFALKNGWTATDVWAKELSAMPGPDGRREVYLDGAERLRLVNNTQPDLQPLVRFLSLMPLRCGAAARLLVGDVDLRTGTVTVRLDKAGAGRTVPLTGAALELVRDQVKNKLPTAPLFTQSNGLAWSKDGWKGPIKTAAAAANLTDKTVLYVLRHSVVTDLIVQQGLDLMTTAKLAGTSVQQIEKHYGKLVDSRARDALAKLA